MVLAYDASEEGMLSALHPGPPFPQGRAELSLCVARTSGFLEQSQIPLSLMIFLSLSCCRAPTELFLTHISGYSDELFGNMCP